MQRGWVGWLGIAAVIAIWDVRALRRGLETMTAAFGVAPRRYTVPAVLYIVAHLFKLIPQRVDPLERIARALSRSCP